MKTRLHTLRLFVLRSALAAALAATLGGVSGCLLAAAGAGAGVVAYVRGQLEVTLPNDYDRVVDATRQALADLEFVKISDRKDELKAQIESRTALDKKVEINLARTGGKELTNVKIRVGVIGDEAMSMTILDKIKSHL